MSSVLDELIDTYEHRDKRASVEGRDFVALCKEIKNLKLAFYELERLHFKQLKEYELNR